MLTTRKTGLYVAMALITGLAIASPGSDYGRQNCGSIAMSDITGCQACCDLGITNGDIGMQDRESCHNWCATRQKWARPLWVRLLDMVV